jgi:hypothetical protein
MQANKVIKRVVVTEPPIPPDSMRGSMASVKIIKRPFSHSQAVKKQRIQTARNKAREQQQYLATSMEWQPFKHPGRVLESMLLLEEQAGKTLYHSGNQLKKSLISTEKVKTYLQMDTEEHVEEKKQWKKIMSFFQKNPETLLDAISTPRGSPKTV